MANIRRPFSVTLIILGVLTITMVNLVRLVTSIQQWGFLNQLPGVNPLYIAVSGLFWFLVGLMLIICLWRGWRITYSLLPPAAVLYLVYAWLDSSLVGGQIVLSANLTTWPFKAGLSVFVLAFLYWTFSRARVKAYFGRYP